MLIPTIGQEDKMHMEIWQFYLHHCSGTKQPALTNAASQAAATRSWSWQPSRQAGRQAGIEFAFGMHGIPSSLGVGIFLNLFPPIIPHFQGFFQGLQSLAKVSLFFGCGCSGGANKRVSSHFSGAS